MYLHPKVLRESECQKLQQICEPRSVPVDQPDYSQYKRFTFLDEGLRDTLQERIRQTIGVPFELSSRINYTSYEDGGYIAAHQDGTGRVRGGDSNVSVLFYLNDDYAGGELLCESLGLTVRPTRGSMIIMRQDLYHSVNPVQGRKYLLRVDGRWPGLPGK